MIPLIVGTVLSLGVLAFVLAPMVVGVRRPSRTQASAAQPTDLAVAALREIEFDRATGKLSDADYATLRERYANEALAAMRRSPKDVAVSDDPVEMAVRAYRATHPSCPTCGIRPEADAIYCSNCGRFLPGTCDSCGVAITAAGVRYCVDCGHRLAA